MRWFVAPAAVFTRSVSRGLRLVGTGYCLFSLREASGEVRCDFRFSFRLLVGDGHGFLATGPTRILCLFNGAASSTAGLRLFTISLGPSAGTSTAAGKSTRMLER